MYSVDEFGYSMLPDHAFQREGGRMRLWGGGKGSAPNPNPGMIASAEAAKEVAKMQQDTANEYLRFSKEQYAENKGFLQDIARAEYDTMLQNNSRAQEYADYEKQTFRPLEQKLVAAAQEYNTDAKREQLAGQAKADVESQYAIARDQQVRELARYGINPSSGRFASLNQQLNLSQAAQSAGAMNRSRIDAENLGIARMMDAAGMGRGLASNASTAYGVGLQAGNQAGNSRMAGANYMGGAYNGAINGLSSAANSYGTAGNIYGQEFSARMAGYNAARQASSSFWGGIGSAAGTVAGALIMAADGGSMKKGIHAGPGPVDGPGGPVDDKVPAMLSNGEYVIPADVVEKKGVKFFDEMVSKHHTPAAEQRKQMARKGIRRK